MKSPKELSLDKRILEMLEELSLPYRCAVMLTEDPETAAAQNYANNVSIVRRGYNDHGPVHMRTVARNAIKIMQLMKAAGIKTSLENENMGSFDDSMTGVIFASFLHDLGMTIGRQDHEMYSVQLALPVIERMLVQLIPESLERRVAVRSIALEGIAGHMGSHKIHSLEAGVILIADGCDMTKGRARIPISLNTEPRIGDIHKYSANSIEKVRITAGEKKPVRIEVLMSSPVGFFQIEEVLLHKVNCSTVKPYIELLAGVEGEEMKQYV